MNCKKLAGLLASSLIALTLFTGCGLKIWSDAAFEMRAMDDSSDVESGVIMDLYFLNNGRAQMDMTMKFGIISKTYTFLEGNYTVESGDITGDSIVTIQFKRIADTKSWTVDVLSLIFSTPKLIDIDYEDREDYRFTAKTSGDEIIFIDEDSSEGSESTSTSSDDYWGDGTFARIK